MRRRSTVPIRRFLAAVLITGSLRAHAGPWQPPEGLQQIEIWPGTVPAAQAGSGPEDEATVRENSVAGRPWTAVGNVARPTITVYSPKADNTGAAVIVFPGGGYTILAIDLEGTEVCDWLVSKGVTCVLLKYRVPGMGGYPKPARHPKSGHYPDSAIALVDAQRAIGLVRARAAEWRVDPHKIGVLGFSAGGHLVAATSTHFQKRLYKPVDAADSSSCRPDFAVALYPGHLALDPKAPALNADIRVTSQTPPTFLLHAEDDPVDPVEHSLVYYAALRRAKVGVEMHLYPTGGHAFGLRPTEQRITHWPALVETWLAAIGMIDANPASR
jgi:acetyl esterase/lipase